MGADRHRQNRGVVRLVALDRQHLQLREQLHGAFVRVLHSGGFTLGEEVARFEAEFAAYCGVRHCVGVSSGTAALGLTLRAAGIGPGDEVIVPAHASITSALGAVHAGATVVLCDVEERTGLIDPDAVRAAIGPRTAAVVAVHLYGQMSDVMVLRELADRYGVMLLEDAADAPGARHCGRIAGSVGHAGTFSFSPSANLGALGEGGAICTDDDVLAARLRRLRNLGQTSKGEHVELGANELLDELQAALLRVKLPHLDAWNDARRVHARRYEELLGADIGGLEERSGNRCVYHVMPVRLAERDRIATALRRGGIETEIHYTPAIGSQPALAGYVVIHGASAPAAEAWAAEELSLPMHPDLQPWEIERVAEAVLATARPLRSVRVGG